jgi:hypothetical protein
MQDACNAAAACKKQQQQKTQQLNQARWQQQGQLVQEGALTGAAHAGCLQCSRRMEETAAAQNTAAG